MSGQLNLVYDVHDGEDIHAAYLVRLTNQDLVEASYRHPHRGTGYGSITLQATSSHHSNLVRGHYVRVRDVDLSYAVVGGFFLDEFEETVLSKKEGGGKLITWKGASTISYLARAVLDDEVRSSAAGPHDQEWIDLTGNWHWGSAGGEAYGDIIRRIIVEAGLQTPNMIPAIDPTGGYASSVVSTATETFAGTYEIRVGTNLLKAVMDLARTGIDVRMNPDTFDIEIVDEGGFVRDKTGAFGAATVRFEGEVNIAADLKRVRHQSQYVSHMVVVGRDVSPFVVTDPQWSSGDPVRGGTLYSDLDHVGDLTRAALSDIRARRRRIEQATFPHDAGNDPTNGVYRPSDRDVGGHYAPGDLVTLHTGSGAGQYNELAIEVAGVTWVLEENGLHSARVELGSSYTSASQQATDNRIATILQPGCQCPRPCISGFPGTDATLALDLLWDFATDMLDTTGTYQGVDHWVSGAGETFSTSHGEVRTDFYDMVPRITVTPGQTVRFAGNVAAKTQATLLTKSFVIKWYANIGSGSPLSSEVIAVAPKSSRGLGVQASFDGSVVAPAGAGAFQIRMDRQAYYDDLVLQVINDDATDGQPGTCTISPIGEPGSEDPGDDTGHYAPADHVHGHGLNSNDETLPHSADAVGIDDDGDFYDGQTVEDALQELGAPHAHDPPTAGVHKILVKRTTDFSSTASNDSVPDYDTVVEDTMTDSWWTAGDPDGFVVTADYDGLDAIFTAKVGAADLGTSTYLEAKVYLFPAASGRNRPISETTDEDYLIAVEQQPAEALTDHFIQVVTDPVTVGTGDRIFVAWRTSNAQTLITYNGRVSITLGAYIVGTPGPTGAAGEGVPVGGTDGQVLAKASGTDFDTEWIDPPSGGVWHPVMAQDPSGAEPARWWVVVDGDGTAVMAEG